MTFRKGIFWLHLGAGLIAGLLILIMSFTGTAIAFQDEVVTYVERDAMRVTPPTPTPARLPLTALISRARDAKPDSRPALVTVSSDPMQVVQVGFGREGTLNVNPYTGEVREPVAGKWRAFFLTMENWHRFLGRSGEQRAIGKAVNDAGNAVFFFLAVSGLFLWWPRKWRTKGLKRSLWFLRDVRSRARDWNWHNVIGFWCAPVLIVLTLSGIVMSYRWANDLVYRATGSPVPVQPSPGNAPAATAIPPPAEGAKPLNSDALLAAAQKLAPRWDSITLRFGGGRGNGGPRPAGSETRSNETPRPSRQPAIISIREHQGWPLFSSTTLTLNPYTGELLKQETFADGSLGRRVRSWLRFLHTGEALGPFGKLVAALASLGACFLVYTGFALAWRRFFLPKEPKEKPAGVA